MHSSEPSGWIAEFEPGGLRPRPEGSWSKRARRAQVEDPTFRFFEDDRSLEPADQHALSYLQVPLEGLDHEAVREQQNAAALPVVPDKLGQRPRTRRILHAPELPPELGSDPCAEPPSVEPEARVDPPRR